MALKTALLDPADDIIHEAGKISQIVQDQINCEAGNKYTLDDIAKHNTPKDCWVALHGNVYDLTKFLPTHPGGDVIKLASGQDATVLFESYHVRGVSLQRVKPYLLGPLQGPLSTLPGPEAKHGKVVSDESDTFYSWDSPFYSTLKQRVVARLLEQKRERRGGYEIWVKAVLILTSFWSMLAVMCLAENFYIALLAAVWMGISAAFVGTCIQHDGNHGSFSRWSKLNRAAGWTLDMIGASAFTWQVQHNLGHHPYTNLLDVDNENLSASSPEGKNIQENDPDVFSSFPFIRMHPHHERKWFHKYQHFYSPFLFSLMTLTKVFQQDFEMLRDRRLYHISAERIYSDPSNVARFYIMKVLSVLYMIVLPCYCRQSLSGLVLYVVGHLACGEMLASFFIVNHVIEGVAFAKRERRPDGKMALPRPVTIDGVTPMERTAKADVVAFDDWAAMQCQTSVNYSPGSWWMNHLSGGLCHQIEHHLFPGLCHTNYVYIQPVVQETCREFGVPYQSETSLPVALYHMLSHLKTLGAEDQPYWNESK
jgi:fatty acid desaturase/cytochrome b involved in lipid metabolism